MNTSEHQQNISRILWMAILILIFSILYWITKWVGVHEYANLLSTMKNIL